MRASVRRSIQALLDGVDMVTMLAGAVSGAAVGYTYYPATLNADLRLAATGAVALGGTFLFTTVADAVLAPLRRRFAQAAYRIDLSDQLLSNPGRWRGYTNGEATYYLAPGAVLHYSREESERGIAEPLYTLLTADDPTPVPVTNVRDILDDLSLRARKTAEALDAVAPSTV